MPDAMLATFRLIVCIADCVAALDTLHREGARCTRVTFPALAVPVEAETVPRAIVLALGKTAVRAELSRGADPTGAVHPLPANVADALAEHAQTIRRTVVGTLRGQRVLGFGT